MKLLAAGLSGASIAVVVFLAAATATVPDSWMLPLRETSTDNAYVQGDVTPIAPKVSGYIVEVAVRDHQLVKAGDVLVRIEDSDYRARENQAVAGVATRRALLANLGNRIDQQAAVIDQATAALRGVEAEARGPVSTRGAFASWPPGNSFRKRGSTRPNPNICAIVRTSPRRRRMSPPPAAIGGLRAVNVPALGRNRWGCRRSQTRRDRA